MRATEILRFATQEIQQPAPLPGAPLGNAEMRSMPGLFRMCA